MNLYIQLDGRPCSVCKRMCCCWCCCCSYFRRFCKSSFNCYGFDWLMWSCFHYIYFDVYFLFCVWIVAGKKNTTTMLTMCSHSSRHYVLWKRPHFSRFFFAFFLAFCLDFFLALFLAFFLAFFFCCVQKGRAYNINRCRKKQKSRTKTNWNYVIAQMFVRRLNMEHSIKCIVLISSCLLKNNWKKL